MLASKVDVIAFGNENWSKTYVQLTYPDYYCKVVTPPLPDVVQAKNYADLVAYDANLGVYTAITPGTLALFGGRCFKCIDQCANWQPGNELYWSLTDFVCTQIVQTTSQSFTALPPTVPTCLSDALNSAAFTDPKYTYSFAAVPQATLRVQNGQVCSDDA